MSAKLGRAIVRIYNVRRTNGYEDREVSARITAKRVEAHGRKYDRTTMRDVSAYQVRAVRSVELIRYWTAPTKPPAPKRRRYPPKRRRYPPKCALCGAFLVVQPDGQTATCTRCKSEWQT